MSDQNPEMTFLEHLDVLRSHLMKSVIAVLLVAIVAFIYKDIVFDQIIFAPRSTDFIAYRAWCSLGQFIGLGESLCLESINYELIATTMLGKFTAHILVSIIAGVILAFPFIFYQVWSFVKPGLKTSEASAVKGVVFYSTLLFFLGVTFGYFVIAPLSLQFLGNYELGDVKSTITITSYMKLVASITLAAGMLFLLPIFVFFFTKIGILTPEIMKKYRRHALIVVLIISAIITPPDITSQVLVATPVLLLYELSIGISRRVLKNKNKDIQDSLEKS